MGRKELHESGGCVLQKTPKQECARVESKEADGAGTQCGGRAVGGQGRSREPGYGGHLKGF